jgi:hypothetical protein
VPDNECARLGRQLIELQKTLDRAEKTIQYMEEIASYDKVAKPEHYVTLRGRPLEAQDLMDMKEGFASYKPGEQCGQCGHIK